MITWYAFAMYCDIVLQPYQRSVLTCLALVTLPLLFDARPRDNVIGSLAALCVFLLLEHLFVDPGTRTMDVLGAYIAVVVGLMVAQRKTASRLNEIIYLDMYRTATKTSILVAQADLRTDTFHALQVPDYMQPVVSKFTSATETLRRVGETFVQSDYLDEYMKFFNMTSLVQRLQKSDQVSCVFQDFRLLWCQVTVVVQSRHAGKVQTVVIIVRDIDAEKHQEHAFEPFSQEERFATSAYTGSGLGLAIVRELVELMGGSITLESTEGVGTKFALVMPFEVDTEHTQEQHAAQSARSLAGKHALLAEDDDLNAEIAEFVLGNEGISVQRVANGREAVDVFAAAAPGTFDLVFMDVMMPVMNGLDATRAIRALDHPDAASVPIFAMTANAFQDDERESLAAGMTAHLTKPLEIEKIREAVATALG